MSVITVINAMARATRVFLTTVSANFLMVVIFVMKAVILLVMMYASLL